MNATRDSTGLSRGTSISLLVIIHKVVNFQGSCKATRRKPVYPRGMGSGWGSNFPYIPLNEIEAMLLQLANQSLRFLSVDLCRARAQML